MTVTPRVLPHLLSAVPLAGVIGWLLSACFRTATLGTVALAPATLLQDGLFWVVGIQGFITSSGHLVIPGHVARSIGWPESPFQWEVGLASISYGVLGVFAAGFGPDWWLAAIVAFAIFYLGAAAGHVREMVARHNFAPGNVGPMLVFDVVAPLLLAGLYSLARPALPSGV